MEGDHSLVDNVRDCDVHYHWFKPGVDMVFSLSVGKEERKQHRRSAH